jgi:hypothetical protein
MKRFLDFVKRKSFQNVRVKSFLGSDKFNRSGIFYTKRFEG